jgi:putative ABC transport system permease protein
MIPVSYNLHGLVVRKTSTVASALGIAMVVFVLATALMLSAGIKRTVGRTGRADNAIVLRKGSDSEMPSAVELPSLKLVQAAPGIARDSDGRPLCAGEVVVVIIGQRADGSGLTNIQIRGVPDNARRLRPEVRLTAGREPRPGTSEVMLGQRLRGRYRGFELGGVIDLRRNRPASIVGVFEADGSAYESEVWGDVESIRSAFGREGVVSSVRVRLDSPSAFDGFKTYVEQDKRLGLEALREPRFFEKQSEDTAKFVTMMGTVIAIFFSIGAMIGAMITMYAAVADRQREIGVLRALGFSRLGILGCFLLEAALLALVGGVVGTGGALLMGFVRISMMNFGSWSEVVFSFAPTPGILLTALCAAAGMGILGGFLPAVRAARVSPTVAMRG